MTEPIFYRDVFITSSHAHGHDVEDSPAIEIRVAEAIVYLVGGRAFENDADEDIMEEDRHLAARIAAVLVDTLRNAGEIS